VTVAPINSRSPYWPVASDREVGCGDRVMRQYWKMLVLAGLLGATHVGAGERLRLKAKLWTGAPPSVNYRRDDVLSRGAYMAMLEKEECVNELDFFRKTEVKIEGTPAPPTPPAQTPCVIHRKVFRSAFRNGATTQEDPSLNAAAVRLEEIRLAAYSTGETSFTGRLKGLRSNLRTRDASPERTDGFHVTIRVRGFSSTEAASLAVEPNGPVLFECSQTFWMSKEDDRVISLVCPGESCLCGCDYQELTHLQVVLETRRNR
jgi:hypothetical protein